MSESFDAKIYKPDVCKDGYSDPVAVLCNGGQILICVWDERDKRWHSFVDGIEDTFDKGAIKWSKLPAEWVYDSEFYTPLKYKEWWREEHNETDEKCPCEY